MWGRIGLMRTTRSGAPPRISLAGKVALLVTGVLLVFFVVVLVFTS